MQGTRGWISEQRKSHTPWSKWARAPQLLSPYIGATSPDCWRPRAYSACSATRKPLQWETCASQQSSPRSPQPEEAHIHHWRPGTEIKKLKKKKKATFWPKWNFNYWGFLSHGVFRGKSLPWWRNKKVMPGETDNMVLRKEHRLWNYTDLCPSYRSTFMI